jgi:hypothetical protein
MTPVAHERGPYTWLALLLGGPARAALARRRGQPGGPSGTDR